MKSHELKEFFEFAMSCLGGALFLACGLRESGGFWNDWPLLLLMGAYVSFIGLVKYNVGYKRNVHFSFVFSLIIFVGVLGNYHFLNGTLWWLAVVYDVLAGAFFLLFLINAYLWSQKLRGHRTAQAFVEICWVLCLVAVLFVYAVEGDDERDGGSLFLNIGVSVSVFASIVMSAVFYLTLGIGYDETTGIPNCLCFIIAETGQHLTFVLQVVFGLTLLSLGLKAPVKSRNDSTVIVVVLVFVFGTGFLSFDLVNHPKFHACFVILFAIVTLVFGLFNLSFDNTLQSAGLITHLVTTVALILCAMVASAVSGTDFTVGVLHIVWILGIVAMFGLYICS